MNDWKNEYHLSNQYHNCKRTLLFKAVQTFSVIVLVQKTASLVWCHARVMMLLKQYLLLIFVVVDAVVLTPISFLQEDFFYENFGENTSKQTHEMKFKIRRARINLDLTADFRL